MKIPSVQIFIVIHDQDLLCESESKGTYKYLGAYTYIFVGNGAVHKILNNENVIIARHLEDNIEEYKYLVSFTAWYAIAKNNLSKSAFTIILEYDIVAHEDFIAKIEESMANPGMLGFKEHVLSHPLFLYATPYLITSLKRVYNINAVNLINAHLEAGNSDKWACTSNYGLSTDILSDFVEWFTPLTVTFREVPIGAHVHERALPIYGILNSINTVILKDILTHTQLASHDIHALPQSETERLIAEIEHLDTQE